MTKHGWCSTHRIAYNRDYDATCPQCILQRMAPTKQYDYDVDQKTPVDGSQKPLDLANVSTAL